MEIFLVPKHVVQMQYLMGKDELKVYTKNFLKINENAKHEARLVYLYTSMYGWRYGTLDELVSEPRLDLVRALVHA